MESTNTYVSGSQIILKFLPYIWKDKSFAIRFGDRPHPKKETDKGALVSVKKFLITAGVEKC